MADEKKLEALTKKNDKSVADKSLAGRLTADERDQFDVVAGLSEGANHRVVATGKAVQHHRQLAYGAHIRLVFQHLAQAAVATQAFVELDLQPFGGEVAVLLGDVQR